jgi:hypothetical protein
LINNGDAIGSGAGTVDGAGIAGTTIAMTRVGLTVVEQPQTVAASGNEHSNVKKKRDRRVIRNTDAANRSGSAEQSSGTSPRQLIQRSLGLRRIACSNFADWPSM